MAGTKSVTLDVLARNADAVAKIEQVKKDYAELKAEVEAGNLDLSAKELNAAYSSQLRSAAKELFNVKSEADDAAKATEDLGKAAEDAGGRFATLHNHIGKVSNAFSSLKDTLGPVISLMTTKIGGSGGLFGGAASEGGGESQGLMGFLMSPVGIVAAAAAVGALTTEVGGLATGLTALAATLGPFTIMSIPIFTQLEKALGSGGGGVSSLPKALQPIGAAVESIVKQFDALDKAFIPLAAPVFTAGLKLVSQVMPALLPLATSVIPSLEQGLNMIAKSFGSPTAKAFTKQMEELGGPVLKALISGMLGLLPDLQQMMAVFSKKDVVNAFNIIFRILGATINLVTGIIKVSMGVFDGLTETIRVVGHWSDWLATNFGRNMRGLYNAVKSEIGAVLHFFEQVPSRIVSALGNVGNLLWNAGVAIMNGLLGGIVQKFEDVKNFIGGVASWISDHKGPISYDATLLVPHGRAIMSGLVNGLEGGMPDLSRQLQRTTSAISGTSIGIAGSGAGRNLQIEWTGGSGADAEFITWLKKNIRIRGGNPAVLGR